MSTIIKLTEVVLPQIENLKLYNIILCEKPKKILKKIIIFIKFNSPGNLLNTQKNFIIWSNHLKGENAKFHIQIKIRTPL